MKMSQQFHAVCCYSCSTFQVHQVKKSAKWQCKLCGSAQHLGQVFVLGNSADCRKYVQNMNLSMGQKREQSLHVAAGNEAAFHTECHRQTSSSVTNSNTESKWTAFLDDTKTNFKEIGTNKEGKCNSVIVSSQQPECWNKSSKRKLDDSFSAKSNKTNSKKGTLHVCSSRGEPISDRNWMQEKPNSLTSEVGKAVASTYDCSSTITYTSKDLHTSDEASQNDDHSVTSSSKWHKFIENS